jgi:hypothetical protein
MTLLVEFLEGCIEIGYADFVSTGCPGIWPAEGPEVMMARTNRDTDDNPDTNGISDKDQNLAQRFSRLTGIPASKLLA